APASFDPAKLVAFQAQYMKQLPLEEKVARALPLLERAKLVSQPASAAERQLAARVIEALGDRIKGFGDAAREGAFSFVDQPPIDEKAFDKRLRAPGAAERLAEWRGWLAEQSSFDAAPLEAGTQAWLAARQLGLGDIVHAVRVAVTG